ncbi:MAG TPA: histidine phosphatase family protein [Caulobacteraceae bacterium]|nr:histidine phosphatase family protein [Caulobacteraceae bacterium]
MIYLIRHGETRFNREGRYQGRVDSPLTGVGRAQARAIAQRLRVIAAVEPGEWQVQTSPLGRARRTAAAITRALDLGAPVVDERLVEVSYGRIEGLTRAQADAAWPELAGLESVFGRAPGGESFEALGARAGAWLAEAEAAPWKRFVAVSHAGVIRTLRGLYLGLTLDQIRALDRPQDALFRLQGGRIERIEAPPLPSAAARS